MAKVTMPQLGESVAEGTIGKWLKQPGDHVAKYEPLLEVITDKVNAEVPVPVRGYAHRDPRRGRCDGPEQRRDRDHRDGGRWRRRDHERRHRSRDGRDGRATATARSRRDPGAGREPARGPAGSDERPSAEPAADPMAAAAQAPLVSPDDQPGNPDARMTPAVRRLLREHGLIAAQIVGTGGGGRITREDVIDHVEATRTGKPVGAQGQLASTSAAAPIVSAPAERDGRPRRLRPQRRSTSRPERTRSSSR